MPRLRVGADVVDAHLHGTVYDAADLLTALTRTNLRSFVAGPWGDGDEELAQEMVRRCATDPCAAQCFIERNADGKLIKTGCGCTSGWQYTSDEDVQTLEGCAPNDVWNDARGLLQNHLKVGRGSADPILCDCDDLTAISAAVAKYEAWKAGGKKTRNGRPFDTAGDDVRIAITRPRGKNMAHAYTLSASPPVSGEPSIRLRVDGRELYVFDPAGRWGMKRPPNEFYGDGEVAVYPVRFEDL